MNTFSLIRGSIVLLGAISIGACDAPVLQPAPGAGGAQLTPPPQRTSDGVLAWNAFARQLIVTAKPNQQEALRALTYLSLAQHRATMVVPSSTIIYEEPSVQRSAIGAVDAASAAVLTSMFPNQKAEIETELHAAGANAVAAGEDADSYAAGRAAGARIAEQILTAAATDNFAATWNGTVPTGAGIWFSSVGKPPLLPLLGKMRPFFMQAGDQFRAPPPPAFGSQAFQTALSEIRNFADTRTAEQDSIAKFWAMATGTLVAGYWNDVAARYIEQYHLDAARAAHLLALMNMAAMDGNIACHDTKYTYWMIRPSQADAGIKLAIGLPNHPSYPSNHACLSGAAALVLADAFPAERKEMEREMEEAIVSRYYAGLHYRFDGDAGLTIARQVASLALSRDRELRGQLQIP